MTLVTLFVHRIRAARHAARQRAPGDVVRALPVRVWTGTGWVCEKDWIASHPPGSEPTPPSSPTAEEAPVVPEPQPQDVEGVPGWFASQVECAICLSSFVRGDRVRVLPCSHVFHVEEVDGWLLNRRKVCPICKADVTHPAPRTTPRVFPVALHPADAEGRTSAGSGTGVLHNDTAESGVGSSSGAAPSSPTSGRNAWWWQRVWRRAGERRQSAATERTPLLSA
ncbi:hypothetical protein FRC10_011723 [Ceratobasidium sp. 414]|nr:hypothetical protein FRC10_011723 [Ceratobasidium sp. 414]